jgi:hypothetical protein
MTSLKNLLRRIEEEQLGSLEHFFLSVYPATYLGSHGLDHHRRVWIYAKELIMSAERSFPDDPSFFLKLMLACFLHDIGMAVEKGMKHGIQSRSYCCKYLAGKGMNPTEYNDLLDAVEYHDDKDYSESRPGNLIYEVLTLADDLDAFGYTGIFRYTEIYSERGSSIEALGPLIAENAAKRYQHFINSSLPGMKFQELHKYRYKILINYCEGLKTGLRSLKSDQKPYSSYHRIAELIIKYKENLNNKAFVNSLAVEYTCDSIIADFLNGLASEE